MSSLYSAADYALALRRLLPRGRAWQDDPESVQGKLLAAIAQSLERVDASGSKLLAESLPGDNTDLLAEWEASLGLPDPCAPNPTDPQRRDQIRARFMGGGGQSRQRYIDYAATLGFTITISNFHPFRAGHGSIGDGLAGDEWSFVWGVTIVANTGGLSSDVLLCELEAIKPAETTVILL